MSYRTLLIRALFVGALPWAEVSAQCSMSIQFYAHSLCGGLFWEVQSVANGSPPYDTQVFHGGQLVASLTNVPASALIGQLSPSQYPAGLSGTSVTVTDAQGCMAEGYVPTQVVHSVLSTLVPTLNCTTGPGTVRFTGCTDANNGGTSFTPCGWPQYICSIDDVEVGTISETWVNEGGGTWRYGQALAAGQHMFTIGAMGCSGDLECWQPTQVTVTSITPGDCGVNFRVKAALDGALPSGTLMADGLRPANLIPTTQPYSALGYTFVGSPINVTITPGQLAVTGNDAIVDWMIAELRSNTTTVVWSKPVLLQRDGDVIDTDGDNHLNFPVTAGNYYVALRHRNHLGVMTSTTRALTVDPAANLIDFRTAATATYGTNGRVLKGSVYCLWAGDATGNGTVKYTGASNDRDPILLVVGGTTPNNTLTGQYSRLDTNLDGVIKYTGTANDRDIILTNVGSTTPNNTRTQQLP